MLQRLSFRAASGYFVVSSVAIPSVARERIRLEPLKRVALRRMMGRAVVRRRIRGRSRDLRGENTVFAIPFMEISTPAVEKALDASPASFRAFYEEALPRVYGYFLHRCGGSIPVAEDLTQETFLAAVAELKKGRRVVTPIAWVYGIARHKLLDHYRRQERTNRPLAVAWETEQVEQQVVVPDDPEARERAIAALAAVAATQRAALVLCYLDGFSVADAARMLDKSVEAVESLLARGRQTFKRAYLDASA